MLSQPPLFYLFSFVLLGSACMVISASNAVHSVLFLILAFVNAAGLFLILGAEFLSLLLVVVYVGAIAVLFLFVTMMLNLKSTELGSVLRHMPVLVLGAILVLELITVLIVSTENGLPTKLTMMAYTNNGGTDGSNIEAIGRVLYTEYAYLVEIIGVILLLAMLGSIVLAPNKRNKAKRQNPDKQNETTKCKNIKLVKVKSREGLIMDTEQ